MKHPIFHPGETCWALVPTSTGLQRMECEITGPLARRSIRDLDGQHLLYAEAYMVLLDEATLETPWAERDLRKKWLRSDWQSLKCSWYGEMRQIWQPRREAR